jgi:hypothetical protein
MTGTTQFIEGGSSYVAETVLAASSSEATSLEGIRVTGIVDGATCYVRDVDAAYRYYAKASSLPNYPLVIVPAAGSGRWVQMTGGGSGGSFQWVSAGGKKDCPKGVPTVVCSAPLPPGVTEVVGTARTLYFTKGAANIRLDLVVTGPGDTFLDTSNSAISDGRHTDTLTGGAMVPGKDKRLELWVTPDADIPGFNGQFSAILK